MLSRIRTHAFHALVFAAGFGATATFTVTDAAAQYDAAVLDALEWTNAGPPRGGRSTGVAGSAERPFEYYFGATGGGLWKTTDGGNTWQPVTDGKINSASVGAVAVCEADPDVVYIGTGETQLRGNIQQGDGVYKSTDAGRTWTHLGLKESQNIARIRVHPSDCNTAWVAAFGKHSIDNPERGIYKTSDGGESWDHVLFHDEKSGGVDISVDPGNPDIIYAALWEAWRKSWGMSSGGPGSGLYKSTDGGENWTNISRNEGLPQEGVLGKIGVALSPSNPDRVWAIIEHDDGGVYRSDDGGDSWERVNEERKLRQRAFYYTRIYADPFDDEVVYVLNTGFYRSRDGGETFPQSIRVPHGDNHDLWIAPDDSDRMINANDGGGNVSFNGGRTWTAQDFATAQFYRVMTTNHDPYWVCGAQQDNSTACIAPKGYRHLSAAGGFGGGAGSHYWAVGGCESGYIANDPLNTSEFYAGCYGGSLSWYDHDTGARRQVNVWPENPMGQSAIDLTERVQWTFPIVFSHQRPEILYTGTQKVWKTTTKGGSWEQISPDLTRADPSTMGPSGGPITLDQTGVETYATVFAIAPSYHDGDVIWVGTDDGYVQITRNEGETWTNVTPPDAPDFVRMNTVEASPHTPGKAYVSGIRYLVDDDRSPYIWKTEDYGETWTKIVNGLPEDDFIRATREDPERPGLLFAASERTVYVSWDDGGNWQPLTQNLPNTQVSDLVVRDDDIILGTHGRSFWIMYGIGPIRQMNQTVADADAWLFDPVDPRRGIENSVEVVYSLKDDADRVTIEFMTADGEVIQEYVGVSADAEEEETEEQRMMRQFGFGGGSARPSTKAGAHKFRWDLRHPGYVDFEGRIFWAARNAGPMALPGEYVVRMTVDDQAPQEQTFEVKLDPRLDAQVAMADLQERFDLAMQVRDRVSEANEAVLDIRLIKGEVDNRLELTDDEEIQTVGTEVNTKLSDVESEIYQVRNQSNQDPLNFPIKLNNKLAALLGIVESGEAAPTEQTYEVYNVLSDRLNVQLDLFNLILREDMSRLNDLLQESGFEIIRIEDIIS